tara:strand:+ start:113 stop:589 length:477 start_codon:yes stop_codon:yes gene_type:complete
MKTYVTMVLLSLASNINALDKAEWSTSSLEGFGENGLAVTVETRKPEQKGQDASAIKTHLESLLKNAGFKIVDPKRTTNHGSIYIAIYPIKLNGKTVMNWSVFQIFRVVEYGSSSKRYKTRAAVRTYGNDPIQLSEKEITQRRFNQFLTEWKKANPRK